MVPRSVQRIIASTVVCVAGCIMMVVQDAFTFTYESTKHVAQVHGLNTPEMQAHFIQMGSLVCVCVCAGVLGRRFVVWMLRVAMYTVYYAVLIVLRIVWKTVRYWCWPAEAVIMLLLWSMHRLIKMLPDV